MADSDARSLMRENIQFCLGALRVLDNQRRWAVMKQCSASGSSASDPHQIPL